MCLFQIWSGCLSNKKLNIRHLYYNKKANYQALILYITTPLSSTIPKHRQPLIYSPSLQCYLTVLYIWNHPACDLLRLAFYFTQYNALRSIHVAVCINSFFFFNWWVKFFGMDIPQLFNHLLIKGYFSGFQFLLLQIKLLWRFTQRFLCGQNVTEWNDRSDS